MSRTILSLVLSLVLCMGPGAAFAREAPPSYRLQYRDFISISSTMQNATFRDQAPETPYGRAYPVRPDGRISLPLIGEIAVGGKTVPEVVAELQERYRSYFGDARFVVNVVKFRPRAVTVLGEVNRPGTYDFDSAPSVLVAVSQAGGMTDWGLSQHIKVLREGQVIHDLQLERLLSGQEQDVLLEDRDVVRVQTPWNKPLVQSLPMISSLLAGLTTLIVFFVRVE